MSAEPHRPPVTPLGPDETPGARDRVRSKPSTGAAIGYSVALATASYVSYWLAVHVLSRVHSISHVDDLVGGMWAVIATVFVYHASHQESLAAGVSRSAATLLSFALCLAYFLLFRFHPLGLVVLIGIGTLLLMLTGHPEYIVTTAITTAVLMVVVAVSPDAAWQQPILRVFDTAIGVAVGIAASFLQKWLADMMRSPDDPGPPDHKTGGASDA
jgi:uncharacterized membrane protein YccC